MRLLFLQVLLLFGLVVNFSLFADVSNTEKQDAISFVKKAVLFFEKNGKENALKEFSNQKGEFVKGSLYLTVWDLKGTQIAHGVNQKLIGKNLIDLKDAEGKEFVKEFMKIGESKSGWVNYKWTNPVSKEIEKKSVYMERVGDILIGCGVYDK